MYDSDENECIHVKILILKPLDPDTSLPSRVPKYWHEAKFSSHSDRCFACRLGAHEHMCGDKTPYLPLLLADI